MKFIIVLLLMPFNIKAQESGAFSSSVTCTILMNMDSKRVLYGENIHTKRSIASITKIMTT